jgi:hypothetical protein
MSKLEEMVRATPDVTSEDLAEGYLFVSGLYKWAIDRVFLGGDPVRPRFVRFMDTFSKWGLANPDNLYLFAEISSDAEYVVTGNRGTCADFIIEVRTGIGRREDNVHSATLTYIEASQLQLDANGSFELRIGGPQRPQNHLPLDSAATTVFVRQTFADWEAETADTFQIERIGPPFPPTERLNLEEADRRLVRAADLMLALGRFNDKTAAEWRAAVPVNSFPPPSAKVGDGFFPGQHSSIGQYRLRDRDQALVVSLDAVEARYLGFSIGHHHWYASLDFENRQCSLNTAQAHLSSDRRYRYVISAADPGVPNWIDTGGRLAGFMFFRCQGLKSAHLGEPEAIVTPLGKVREVFPSDEPVVGSLERLETLRRRRRAVYGRFAY